MNNTSILKSTCVKNTKQKKKLVCCDHIRVGLSTCFSTVGPTQPRRSTPWRAHTPGIHSPAPRIAAQMAGLAWKGQKTLSFPLAIPLPGNCSSPPCCWCRLRNGMQCCCLPQYLCRNPPQTLGYSCKDKRIAPTGRHLLQKTTFSGTTTVLSLSLSPSFPVPLPSFSKY